MDLNWRRDAYSWAYILVNFVLFVLAFMFWLQKPREVDVVDVERVDAPYLAVLLAAYTSGVMYTAPGVRASTPALMPPPAKLSLETLGSYQVMQTAPSKAPKKIFGLDATKMMLLHAWYAEPRMVEKLKNRQFTGLQKEGVAMASPMWTYEHNLHILNANFCSDAQVTAAMNANRINGVNSVVVIPAAGTTSAVIGNPARVLECSPAYPTMVDYKRCYKTVLWHKSIFAFYSLSAMVLWIVSTACYISKASHQDGFGNRLVPYVQRFSLFFNVLMLAILSVAINYGIPALQDKKNVCPDKQTGLLSLYEIFLAVFIGIILVVVMHMVEEVRTRYYPYVSATGERDNAQATSDSEAVAPGGYSCNYPT